MFVVCRKLPGNDRWCVLICRSVRTGSKVSQKIIKYFGVVNGEEERKAVVVLAKREILSLKQSNPKKTLPHQEPTPPSADHNVLPLENIVEVHRVTEGFHDILGTVFDNLSLKPLLTKTRYQQLRNVVIARIAQPASKLRTAKILQNTFHKQLSEDQIYRLMDELESLEDLLKAKVCEETKRVLGLQKVELLLFDVTTLYFESQKNDELREFGYSKDHKIGETQVVLALATAQNGCPIGYSLFQGNTAETSTLLKCLNEWKNIFDISKVIVVADRAMMSESNLQIMEEHKITYVVAAKLKSLPVGLKNKILDRKLEAIEKLYDEPIRIQEHTHRNRRLIVNYSDSRAKKDASDRERLLAKVRKKLGPSNKTGTQKLVTNRGYLKFVDSGKEGEVVLNEEKIAKDERWDGLHGLITNDKTSSAVSLLERYRNLWVIEESFRLNKHTLSMRPIYHFSPKRIRAHILICYLAFAVTRYAHQQVNIFDQKLSIEDMRDALAGVEASTLENRITGQRYVLPSPLGKEASMIYRAMGIVRGSCLRTLATSRA